MRVVGDGVVGRGVGSDDVAFAKVGLGIESQGILPAYSASGADPLCRWGRAGLRLSLLLLTIVVASNLLTVATLTAGNGETRSVLSFQNSFLTRIRRRHTAATQFGLFHLFKPNFSICQ